MVSNSSPSLRPLGPRDEPTGKWGIGGLWWERRGFIRRNAVPIVVLAISLSITAALAGYVSEMVRARDEAQFRNAVQATQDRIRGRLATYIALLSGAAGLFDASDHVSAEDFHDYVDELDVPDHYPGIQAIGFSMKVAQGETAERVKEVWAPHTDDFHLWPAHEGPRQAVVFVEPDERRNRAAFGFDFSSELACRDAMARATDDGRPATSARMTLAQEIDGAKQADFVIFVPVYEPHAIPATVEARRAALRGFAFGAFRGDDLFQGIFGSEREPRVGFEVYDGDVVSADHLLHSAEPADSETRAWRFTTTEHFGVGGRSWTLWLHGRGEHEVLSVAAVIAGGLLTSGLLFIVMLMQVRGRNEAERTAANLRRSERSLRGSESRFRTLIERLPAAISVYVEGRVAFSNPAMKAMVAPRPVGESTGGDALASVVVEDRELLARALEACRQSEDSGPVAAPEGVAIEVRHVGPSEAVQTEGLLLPIVFDGLPAVLGVWQDVTSRRALAARMMQMDRMIAVGTLAAGVAHEINNPLAYLMANLDYVLSELRLTNGATPALPQLQEESAEIVQALVEARDGADRVRRIVRDLKTYSRVDEDRRGAVDIHSPIEWAVAMAENEIRHRARLIVNAPLLPAVEGDEGRLGQVLLNLLVNAAQAIPEGAADQNEIRVTAREDGSGHVVVEVRDSGSGIAPENLGRIFDPFFTTKPVGVGTGLGLAISQRIVADCGGELRVESQLGQGTTFRVILLISRGQRTAPNAGEQATAPTTPRRPRVLVIDDEPHVLRSIERGLSSTHEVVAVARSKEALSRLRAGERFDAILCDLMMPEMTGMDLHLEVVALGPEIANKMVFITGGAFTPRAREFLDQVPNARLEKPFDLDSLRLVLSAPPRG